MRTNDSPSTTLEAPAASVHTDAPATADATIAVPEQLSLLGGTVPLQFRLDERTRRSGLQHIAELRQQMAAQAAARRTSPSKPVSKPVAPRTRRRDNQIAA